MVSLRMALMAGCAGFAVTVVTLYVILSEEDRLDPLDPALVAECRGLARQSMDLAVEAARADLDANDPADADAICGFQVKADDLQTQMDDLGCSENADRWVYGSFKQEMIELERYIADLLRDSGGG